MENDRDEQSGGIFKATKQVQQAPVIAITNGTYVSLRLTLQDVNGLTQTELIAAGESKELTVAQGNYQALIDSPDTITAQQTSGTVDVKDFHHYDAEFVLIHTDGPPPPFYIGD